MQGYKTVKEKAVEWNLSIRHIQYLCKYGKIEGIIKRAGSWYIPHDIPTPARNSKSGAGDFHFVGTKNRIFNIAIELFMLKGFDQVTLMDIAHHVGIRQSTIYNHFRSKQEILDTIYDFCRYYYLKNRPTPEDMGCKLQEESLSDIMEYVRYDFEEEYEQTLLNILRIIVQRMNIDKRSEEIGKTLMMDEEIQYIEHVFNMGIEKGRFVPFDTHVMAVFITSIRLFIFYNRLFDPSPDNMAGLAEDEQTLYKYAAGFIREV